MTALILLLVATCLLLWRYVFKQRGILPPGPPSWPIVGNILKLPPEEPWLALSDMRQKYGDLTYLHGLGNKVLVLNSLSTINDLLHKRSGVYSQRPIFTVAGELMGLTKSLVFMPYGSEWREHRRMAHMALNQTAVKKYQGIQEDIASLMCRDILEKPQEFHSLVRLAAGRIVISVTYGISVPVGSEYIDLAEEAMDICGRAVVPGAYLCDTLPFLKHLPSWMPFHRDAERGREAVMNAINEPFKRFNDELRRGIARPSLAHDLTCGEMERISEESAKWVLGSMYVAGSETTHGITITFILAMALHPEIQRLAQAEIDSLLDEENRMPVISDLPRLPYLNAVIKETMRWQPILPLCIARRTGQESDYDGYTIPKDTVVIPNVWSVAFAPDDRYDPHAFLPDRFLPTNTQPPPDPSSYIFGFGKRMCPGKPLGEGTLFIFIASILSAFTISLPEETMKNPPAFQSGLTRFPKPFECNLVPRSEVHADRLKRRAEQCQS
ncbi:cytochrome P450 [Marasmius fiardii PR-910]|nr:cytochrome P450 [Marasmius fiardii PR-910]